MTQPQPQAAVERRREQRRRAARKCCDVHCNSLWSIWLGLLVVGLQALLIYRAVTRFLIYIALPWPDGKQPYLELNLFVGLVGAGVVLLPFYVIAFLFKIGNLANDGHKLGFQLSACSSDPPSVFTSSGEGFIRNSWHHGGPTAPFIHLVAAFCFILPKIFIEARLIDVGFLTQDHVWKTDLDWLVPRQDRLVILKFLTGGAVNATLATTTVAPYHHPAAQIRDYLEQQETWWPVSPEFINYGLALLVYAVRYPAVFWNTNKGFSFVFSLQLVTNAIQNLISIGAISVMYKVQLLGPQNVLHKYEPFLLNPPICMLLYVLSAIIMTASSCVLYMYGYHKLTSFIAKEREKRNVVLRDDGSRSALWGHFPHCSAMCALIALAVCNAPLLYDFTLIYKGSLDGAALTHVVATVLHLFFWVVVWLFLTAKQNWRFKLRVTVGRAAVKNAPSIKLLNDVDLDNDCRENEDDEAMLIVAFGKSFTVRDQAPKKLIMNTLARAAIERDREMEDEGICEAGEDVVLIEAGTAQRRMRGNKVTFNEASHAHSEVVDRMPASPRIQTSPLIHHPQHSEVEQDEEVLPPPPGLPESPSLPPPNAALLNVAPSSSASTSSDAPSISTSAAPPTVNTTGTNKPIMTNPRIQQQILLNEDVQSPRSNRSVDSGLPHDDITPRSDSISTASSSASPPDQHHHHQQQQHQHQHQLQLQHHREMQQQHRKSTSLDDITIPVPPVPGPNAPNGANHQGQQWKSASLQRGIGPPVAPPIVPAQNNAEPIYESQGTLVIRRKTSTRSVHSACATDDEDPYGRCLNLKMSSFVEGQNGKAGNVPANQNGTGSRDPRIIDLTHHSSSTTVSASSTPRQGSPVQLLQPQPQQNQFNTLPAQVNGNVQGRMPAMMNNTGATLPARVNGNHHSSPQHSPIYAPGGRHFKPFDHRRMNPMAEIKENGSPPPPPAPAPLGHNGGNLIVQKSTNSPHLPAELRHTNYSSNMIMNPTIAEHQQRDSANYSMESA